MIYAVISDVHANAIALDAVLVDARKRGAERIVCLGDVVGYGPEPNEVAERVRKACHATVAGNHDDAVSGRGNADDFNEFAANAAARHRAEISSENRAWLATLPYVFAEGGFACAHGEFSSPPDFDYVFNAGDAIPSWRMRDEQLLFVGHTHAPQVFVLYADGLPRTFAPHDFTLEEGRRYVVNPGSVGFPRGGGSNLCSYCTYDSDSRAVAFHFLPFDLRGVMPAGRETARFPWKPFAVAGAFVATAAVALSSYLLFSGKPSAPVEPPPAVVESPAPQYDCLRNRTLKLAEGEKNVYCTVRLARKSAPVQLHVAFKSLDGKILREEWKTVKRSATNSKVAVPEGAVYAILEVRRCQPEDDCRVEKFDFSTAKSK